MTNALHSTNRLSKLLEVVSKLDAKPVYENDDERFWKPTRDKSGNGAAIIRFLPAPKNEEIPFVRLWSHSFQGPTGAWYIENCLSSIGKPDPVTEMNSQLWNTNNEKNKEIARQRKRKLFFISNIYVIKDSGNPQNEGKVFLFRYGKKIFDKMKSLMNPTFDTDKPVDPWDMLNGADFKMKIKTVDKFPNYDDSAFDVPRPLFVKKDGTPDEDKMLALWDKVYPIQEFLDPSKFKDYNTLKAKLMRVIGGQARADLELNSEDEAPPFDLPTERTNNKSSRKSELLDETFDEDDEFKSLQELANS